MGLGVCCFVVFRFGVYFLFAILVIGLLFIVLQLLVNWAWFLVCCTYRGFYVLVFIVCCEFACLCVEFALGLLLSWGVYGFGSCLCLLVFWVLCLFGG